MQIRWEEDAISDLINLKNHIQKDNPTAAEKIAHKVLNSINSLIDYPLLGKAGRIHKTRELIIPASKYTVYNVPTKNNQIKKYFYSKNSKI